MLEGKMKKKILITIAMLLVAFILVTIILRSITYDVELPLCEGNNKFTLNLDYDELAENPNLGYFDSEEQFKGGIDSCKYFDQIGYHVKFGHSYSRTSLQELRNWIFSGHSLYFTLESKHNYSEEESLKIYNEIRHRFTEDFGEPVDRYNQFFKDTIKDRIWEIDNFSSVYLSRRYSFESDSARRYSFKNSWFHSNWYISISHDIF
jgi:hypothetical protein